MFKKKALETMDDEPVDQEEAEEDTSRVLIIGVLLLSVAVTIPVLSRVPRNRGANLIYHAAFVAVALLLLFFVPEKIQDILFSEIGVLIFGTLLPMYESIVAVCTIGEADDTAWLQYWVASGTFTYATEFMDIIADKFPTVGEHWYEFEFFAMLWLLLPFTDGSTLIYDKFTKRFLAPSAQKMKGMLEGRMQIIMAAVNSGYLGIVWMAFTMLPEEARRFVTVAVGTVYPLIGSTAAITTESDVSDDTFWLTYWTCFSCLFMAMDYLENFVGHIRGFYSLCLCATVYLFLPMFRGAEAFFRNVLVPLSGQYENMLLRDAYMVRKDMESKMPPEVHESVFTKAADIFKSGKDKKA